MEKLPIYTLEVDDTTETGFKYVAMVDEPAIEFDWIALSKEQEFKFTEISSEKRIVAGPLIAANKPIYRRDEQGKEFYVTFSPETIEKCLMKFFKFDYTKNVNEMHNPEKIVDGIYMYQAFIINRALGINPPKGYEALKDGSVFAFYKIENDAVWEKVKNGTFKGYSIEGKFTPKHVPDLNEQEVGLIANFLKATKFL